MVRQPPAPKHRITTFSLQPGLVMGFLRPLRSQAAEDGQCATSSGGQQGGRLRGRSYHAGLHRRLPERRPGTLLWTLRPYSFVAPPPPFPTNAQMYARNSHPLLRKLERGKILMISSSKFRAFNCQSAFSSALTRDRERSYSFVTILVPGGSVRPFLGLFS